jgi:glutathione S-transferase
MAARDRRVTRAFAGRLRRWPTLPGSAGFVSRDEGTRAPGPYPFGQIPTYEEGDLALFETGSIVFHIADHHAGLLPENANARARAITWMFAAVNAVEPAIRELATARLLEGDKPCSKERLPLVEDRVRDQLKQVSARPGDADWLDGAFSAGDLMMVSVLLRLRAAGILDEFSTLAAYVARGEARPVYKRAFAAQLAVMDSWGWWRCWARLGGRRLSGEGGTGKKRSDSSAAARTTRSAKCMSAAKRRSGKSGTHGKPSSLAKARAPGCERERVGVVRSERVTEPSAEPPTESQRRAPVIEDADG